MEKQLKADEARVTRPKPVVETPPQDSSDRSDNVGRARLLSNQTRVADRLDARAILIREWTQAADRWRDGGSSRPSHHGRNPARRALRKIERAEMVAIRDFLTALRGTKEGAATLLDRTQVLLGSTSVTPAATAKQSAILLAGVTTGQHIAGNPSNNTRWVNFLSMLQRFGADVNQF
jgi:hypothetical protein